MKKKILIATAAVAATAAFGFETWFGDKSVYQVNTELGNSTKTYGYWFDYNDKDNKGQSKVTYPVAKGNDYSDDALDPVIESCKGVCGTAVINKGGSSYEGFVGIGINVVGEASETDHTPQPGDASAWGGVCIAYSSDVGAKLELGLGDAKDKDIGYDNPSVSLPKAESGIAKDFTWSEFKQQGWETGKPIASEEAAKILVALKFKIQGPDGSYHFNIMSIGPNKGGCAVTGGTLPSGSGDSGNGSGNTAIGDVSMSSAKAILSGRTLSFSGISNAKVEILNLQGQIVMKGSAASSMNLMGLDAGVYMVRIAGKAVNMSQKILVK